MPRRIKEFPLPHTYGMPDFRDGIAAWNAAWELSFPFFDSTVRNLEKLVESNASGEKQEKTHWNYNLVRGVRSFQAELHVLAVTSFLEPNSGWKTLTPAVREAHMLEGLFRTCLRQPVYMPNTRIYTSDITLASMETDNGEGFLTLLKKYVPDEASVMEGGSTLYLHPGWTKETIERLENAGHAMGVQTCKALRDHFLASFLYNTFSSVVGIPRVIETDGNEPTPLHWGTRICEGCGDREGNGARFLVCSICNENVSRRVFYCSKTCQKSDWPNHKKVCGKELTSGVVEDATCSTKTSSIEVFFLNQMGPARDGYSRSQALLRQMHFLEAVPFCSYVFFSPTGPRRIKSPVFITYLLFRLAVQTAMATGDERCIAAVLGMVPEFQDAPSGFVDQLIEEYGKTRVSVAMAAVQTGIDMDALPIMGQWIAEFLKSEAGSQYAKIASEPPEGPSKEVTRKVITDLREWWPRRS
ncbi:hypothetical protein B0H16DRAFT_1554512 [Mycena metata]|uniref:MYND-type domain-containing protein n=1 Tax=Mycena metata TaxID=1033252 RepID=A0AAD7IPK6_9AGAR|nr:hypothetical protein B0H16DRAFT_1554512 [Mycena metata]